MAKTIPPQIKPRRYSDSLKRLRDGLDTANVPKRGRNPLVAEQTGYSLGMVARILSGHAEMTPRFVQAVCSGFRINKEWVETGTGEILKKADTEEDIAKWMVDGATQYRVAVDMAEKIWGILPVRIMQLSRDLSEVEQKSLFQEISKLLKSTGRGAYVGNISCEQIGTLRKLYKIKPFRFQFTDEQGNDCDSGFPPYPNVASANPQYHESEGSLQSDEPE